MAKKTLDTTAIANELQHSAFFPAPIASVADEPADLPEVAIKPINLASSQPTPATLHPTLPETPPAPAQSEAHSHTPIGEASAAGGAADETEPPQPVEQTLPTETAPSPSASSVRSHIGPASSPASPPAREHASMLAPMPIAPREGEPGCIEVIRKAVRHVGKEVSFVRLTPEEKRQLTDIAYTYKSQGLKTSENEISRIGINWMLEDYHANGQQSMLAQVLAALDA